MNADEQSVVVRVDLPAAVLCTYCGAPLNHAFYFCLSCATPYKSLADVLPPYMPRALSEAESIRKKVPQVWGVFWTYAVVVFLAGMLWVLMGGEEDSRLYALLIGSVAFALVTVVFVFMYRPSLAVQLKRAGFGKRHAWLGLGLLAPMLSVNYGLYVLFSQMEPGLRRATDFADAAHLGAAGALVVICLLPGITEEIAFRGLIQHWLQTTLRPWRAIVLAAALFTALHVSIISAPYLFCLGVLLGWVKWKTGSLYPSMVIHILHNWAVIGLFPLIT